MLGSFFLVIRILLIIYYIPAMCYALSKTSGTFSYCSPYNNFVGMRKLTQREDY